MPQMGETQRGSNISMLPGEYTDSHNSECLLQETEWKGQRFADFHNKSSTVIIYTLYNCCKHDKREKRFP